MNEPRFIELLNLYVDQQLSPQEAAELELEIQANPARHRTYQQYCRMQKACAQLFEHERSAAPASTLARSMAEADRKIVAFPERPARRAIWPAGFSIAAVAAAACVAFVVVRRTNTDGPVLNGPAVAAVAPSAQAQIETAVVPVVAAENVNPAVALASAKEFKPVFTVQPLRAAATKADGLFVSVSNEDAQLLDWTRQVELKPLRKVSLENFAFDQRAPADKPVTMKFSSAPDESASEMNAIQFTR